MRPLPTVRYPPQTDPAATSHRSPCGISPEGDPDPPDHLGNAQNPPPRASAVPIANENRLVLPDRLGHKAVTTTSPGPGMIAHTIRGRLQLAGRVPRVIPRHAVATHLKDRCAHPGVLAHGTAPGYAT